jgi:hypothetical protein
MCAGAGINYNPKGYTPKDTSGLVNRGNAFGMAMYTKPYAGEATPSSVAQSSGNTQMPYSEGQQQAQPASMPRATTGRFSFNNGNFRIGESTMNSSDAGLNI